MLNALNAAVVLSSALQHAPLSFAQPAPCCAVPLTVPPTFLLTDQAHCIFLPSVVLQWNQGKGSSTLGLLWQAPGSQRWEQLPVTVPPKPFGPGPWSPLT